MIGFLKVIVCSFILYGLITDEPIVRIEDFIKLTSGRWKGSLTYKDYTTGNPVNIPAEIEVIQSADNPSLFIFNIYYPDEPHANSADSLLISDDGKKIGDESVINRFYEDSRTVIVTTKLHSEEGRQFTFRYTYKFDPRYLYIGKEESETVSDSYEQRNYFEFRR